MKIWPSSCLLKGNRYVVMGDRFPRWTELAPVSDIIAAPLLVELEKGGLVPMHSPLCQLYDGIHLVQKTSLMSCAMMRQQTYSYSYYSTCTRTTDNSCLLHAATEIMITMMMSSLMVMKLINGGAPVPVRTPFYDPSNIVT